MTLGNFGHERAGRTPLFHQAIVFQFAISPCDGVRIDPKILCQTPNGRQLVTHAQLARHDPILDLIEDLLVNRSAVRRYM